MMFTENSKMTKRILMLPANLWFTLFLMAAAAVAFPNTGEKKTGINETFRGIAREMETAYNNGNLKRVIKIYEENCSKGDIGSIGNEKKTFKKVNKEIRANIYRWMFLTYSALDLQETADIFLKKYLVLRHREGIGSTWLFLKNRVRDQYITAPRWLLGIRGGINFTSVNPGLRHKILEPINDNEPHLSSYEKEYQPKLGHNLGGQVGLIIEYRLTKNVSICTQPTSLLQEFRYKSKYTWGDDDANITDDYTHLQWLINIEIPFLLKYRFLNSKLKPYIQAGTFYGVLSFADSRLRYNRIQTRKGIERENAYSDYALIKKQLKSSYIGLLAGVGIGFRLGRNILIEIEGNYKYRFGNIVDEKNRYKNDRLSFEHFDVFDDMKLTNWELNLKLLLPLSFKAFKK